MHFFCISCVLVTPMDTPPPTTHPPPTPSSPVMTYSSLLPITPTSSVVATPTFQLPTSPSPGNSRSIGKSVFQTYSISDLTFVLFLIFFSSSGSWCYCRSIFSVYTSAAYHYYYYWVCGVEEKRQKYSFEICKASLCE